MNLVCRVSWHESDNVRREREYKVPVSTLVALLLIVGITVYLVWTAVTL